MSFAAFIFLLFNIFILLGASSTLVRIDKNRAKIFAIIALMLSIMPWLKIPTENSYNLTPIEIELLK